MGECKNCANMDNEYCFACDDGNQFRPMANGNRIRAMNNEELRDEYFRILNHVLPRYTDSRAGLLEWLKQPAE